MSPNPCIKVNPRSEQELLAALARVVLPDPGTEKTSVLGIQVVISSIVPPGRVAFVTKEAVAWFDIQEMQP